MRKKIHNISGLLIVSSLILLYISFLRFRGKLSEAFLSELAFFIGRTLKFMAIIYPVWWAISKLYFNQKKRHALLCYVSVFLFCSGCQSVKMCESANQDEAFNQAVRNIYNNDGNSQTEIYYSQEKYGAGAP